MSEGFVGEIRMGGWNFAPQGWALCNGAILAISQFETLFTLIGTTYGGDGVNTFQLPDFQGRIPIHQGNGFVEGQKAGSETVTLTTQQIPAHSHKIFCNANTGTSSSPNNLAPAKSTATTDLTYNGPNNPTQMAPLIGNYGGSQPHDNVMPYQCVTFIIALFGVFPSRN